MHTPLLYASLGWSLLLVGVTILLIVRLRSPVERILALDLLTLILVSVLALFSIHQGNSFYLDAALVLALLAFVGTVAASRYLGREGSLP